jgi:eukaryotic-like serine/threonine-protein kinase
MASSMTAGPGGAVVVSDRYQIEPDRPLPELDYGSSKAFAATELRDAKRGLYAVLPDPAMSLRFDAITSIRRIDNNNLIRFLGWDVVDWPIDNRRRPALIFERPHGPRLFPAPDAKIEPFREEPLVRRVMQPLCQVLEEFAFLNLPHRNIRAENLYYDGADPLRSPIMLGECVSSPPGYLQPVVYETIECGMAHPAGRGAGSASNDFYALGVTLAFLMAGRNPFAGMTDEQVVDLKLAKGSYAVFVNGQRIPSGMIEVFRGLLNDDANERWGLIQLQGWLGGRRASPKQQMVPGKASRPIEIAGHSYMSARAVSEAMSRHWDEGLALLQSGELDQWLRRGLADEDRIEAVNTAKTAGSEEDEINDVTLARVCIALDPVGLVRLRNFRTMIDGVGGLLAVGLRDEAMRDAFTTIAKAGIVSFCLQMISRPRPDTLRAVSTFERISPVVHREEIGFGIERALYALNPNSSCRSPMFESDYVAELDRLIPALDRLARTKGSAFDSLIDRHIAAFVGARLKANIVPELRELRDAKDHVGYALPAARILSLVQLQTASDPAPALCAAVATMLEPSLARFHNRNTRDVIRGGMREVATTGRLSNLVAIADDATALELDEQAFRVAAKDYAVTVKRLERLEYERVNRTAISHSISSQVASLLSGVAATIAVLVTILVKLI